MFTIFQFVYPLKIFYWPHSNIYYNIKHMYMIFILWFLFSPNFSLWYVCLTLTHLLWFVFFSRTLSYLFVVFIAVIVETSLLYDKSGIGVDNTHYSNGNMKKLLSRIFAGILFIKQNHFEQSHSLVQFLFSLYFGVCIWFVQMPI